MRWKQTLIPTLREVPKDVEATSHRFMLKAGYVRKLSAGVYSYLPLGFRVLQKIIRIIREEMSKVAAEEVLLPALHPSELWKKSGRFEALGEDKISFLNRAGQEFVLGPTHEEVVTDLVSAYVQSYQDLPFTLYQIQTKFRDELRPRFGIVRTKEFIMKDAYSFHRDEKDLALTYQKIYEVYKNIMARIGLEIRIVEADSGIMGGSISHEFMVVCPYGEDKIAICDTCRTAVSRDAAHRHFSTEVPEVIEKAGQPVEFDTPDIKTIAELSERFKIKESRMIKTILYVADLKIVAACVLGVDEVNESKLKKTLKVKALRLATPEEIERATGAPLGFSGPVGLKGVSIIVDADILKAPSFVTGANQKNKHLKGVHFGRDFRADQIADIRFAKEGDSCPKCHAPYQFLTAMEIGHTFQLGTRYSKPLEANFRDEKGEVHPIVMGCYGIGVNRLIAAAIEQHNDEKGIVWPISIAPFQIILMTLNEADEKSRAFALKLYGELEKASYEVLYDDRNERVGVKFNDAELIGIPIQVIVSERNLAEGQIEIKTRKDKKSVLVSEKEFIPTLQKLILAL